MFRSVLTLALGAVLAAGPVARAFPLTVSHDVGRTHIERPPKRVVALGPHALDLLLSLGVQPVGYGEAAQLGQRNFGAPIRDIRYLGSRVRGTPINVGDRFQPNLEVLTALRPDLIVGENFASGVYPQLSRIAPTLLFRGIRRNDWQRTLPLLARALGREAQAARVIKQHQERLARAQQQLSPALRGKNVLVLWNAGGTQKDLFTVLGPEDWTGALFEDLGMKLLLPGARDPALATDGGYSTLGVEALAGLDPDAVFVIASGKNTPTRARRDWEAGPIPSRLRASRNGHVWFLDVQLFSRIRGPIATELALRELQRQGGLAGR
ncbi:ABC transporter substrate-binding protein [Deinococcus sp. YIM 77859]|uniref:ABC transporter substrate-binding protein n=1 Tax=Deinococcus sp. YIM 77859 TaxID=1540221 RepID=UPI0006899E25|nr:iron-siderophore ABC transporter substrate-binding protein [Deinococcus sp. YIM 77859]